MDKDMYWMLDKQYCAIVKSNEKLKLTTTIKSNCTYHSIMFAILNGTRWSVQLDSREFVYNKAKKENRVTKMTVACPILYLEANYSLNLSFKIFGA